MKLQRLLSLCCLLPLSTLCAPVSAQAAVPQIDYYKAVTKAWSRDTITTVLQCEIPSSMQLTADEKEIYRVGFGEGYDYGHETCLAEITEQLAQEGSVPPNATQVFAQYSTDTFSILLPVSWNVGTRTSYQRSDQEMERFFAESFIGSTETVLIGLTPSFYPFQITQSADFFYHPSMATFTNDEIQSAINTFSTVQQQNSDAGISHLADMDFSLLKTPQATFILQTTAMHIPDTDEVFYALVAYLLTEAGPSPSLYDLYFTYTSAYELTQEDMALLKDILLSIHFYE